MVLIFSEPGSLKRKLSLIHYYLINCGVDIFRTRIVKEKAVPLIDHYLINCGVDIFRTRIVKEKAVPLIDHYLFEEHEMIQRAAVECLCNLVMNEQVRYSRINVQVHNLYIHYIIYLMKLSTHLVTLCRVFVQPCPERTGEI